MDTLRKRWEQGQNDSYTAGSTKALHKSTGLAFVQGISVGNIYISDASGIRYALSLPKNIRTDSGECEFDRVSSLEGVYIANYREDPSPLVLFWAS